MTTFEPMKLGVARRKGYGRWVQAAAAVATVAVGVARVRERAHWPTDVLVGMRVGLASARLASLVTADRRPVSV